MFPRKSAVLRGLAIGLALGFSASFAVAKENSVRPRTAISFNWHANAAKDPVDRINQARLIRVSQGRIGGRGSWVCSPAGSGRRSSCVSR